jgi:hypothetical protein
VKLLAMRRQLAHCSVEFLDQVIARVVMRRVNPTRLQLMRPLGRRWKTVGPFVAFGIEQINVPRYLAWSPQALSDDLPYLLMGVMKMTDPRVLHSFCHKAGRNHAVQRKHVDPHDTDADVCL